MEKEEILLKNKNRNFVFLFYLRSLKNDRDKLSFLWLFEICSYIYCFFFVFFFGNLCVTISFWPTAVAGVSHTRGQNQTPSCPRSLSWQGNPPHTSSRTGKRCTSLPGTLMSYLKNVPAGRVSSPSSGDETWLSFRRCSEFLQMTECILRVSEGSPAARVAIRLYPFNPFWPKTSVSKRWKGQSWAADLIWSLQSPPRPLGLLCCPSPTAGWWQRCPHGRQEESISIIRSSGRKARKRKASAELRIIKCWASRWKYVSWFLFLSWSCFIFCPPNSSQSKSFLFLSSFPSSQKCLISVALLSWVNIGIEMSYSDFKSVSSWAAKENHVCPRGTLIRDSCRFRRSGFRFSWATTGTISLQI